MIASAKRLLFQVQPVYRKLRFVKRAVESPFRVFHSLAGRAGLSPERWERALTLLKSAAVIAFFIYLAWLFHVYYVGRHVQEDSLSLAVACVTVEGVTIVLQVYLSIMSKVVHERRNALAMETLPEMRQMLAAHASGRDRTARCRIFARFQFQDLEACLTELLGVVDGQARERLSELAVALGYRNRWERQSFSSSAEERRRAASMLGLLVARDGQSILMRLLDDSSPLVQAAASRSLLESTRGECSEQLFVWSLDRPFVVQVMMASALRPWADRLARRAIPAGLTSERPAGILATLRLVEAWRTRVHGNHIRRLLFHDDPEIRAAALRTLPYQRLGLDVELLVLAGLASEHTVVQQAAAECCSSLSLNAAINGLEASVRAGGGAMGDALRAMAALEDGRERVERILTAPDARARALAAEALERSYLARQEALT